MLASQPFHAIDTRGWLLLAGVGGFGALAQLCMTAAYKRGRTLASASLAYSTVVFSSALGVMLWDESLPWLAWGGIALIVISGLVATILPAHKTEPPLTG
jgi:S-adenosylmethionine uptake transporter